MSVKKASELKRIQTRIAEQTERVKEAQRKKSEADKETKEEQEKLTKVKSALKKFNESNTEPVVTEHALLRYCERVLGIDLEEVKSKILSDQVRGHIDHFGSGTFPNNGAGFKVIVKKRQVVSVTT